MNAKNYPLVVLVVPVHNNREDTVGFLKSLSEVAYPNYRTIIIDDGSTDDTQEVLRRDFPEVIVLEGDGSLWWSGATNRGIEKAIEMGADYVLSLDNDTALHPQFITALVDTAEANPRSIVGPKSYYYYDPKRIWEAGCKVELNLGRFANIGLGELDEGQYDTQREVDSATVAFLVNTAFFSDIGLMDERRFPQYYADADFMLRARKKGYRIICEPHSMVWHKVGSTTKKMPWPAFFASRLVYLATSRRSSFNLLDAFRFYRAHCPWWAMPYAMSHKVVRLLAAAMFPGRVREARESPGSEDTPH